MTDRQPSRATSSYGRRGLVFSIRLTEEERKLLERAAELERAWWSRRVPLGPWIKHFALVRARLIVGKASGGHRRSRPGRDRGNTGARDLAGGEHEAD